VGCFGSRERGASLKKRLGNATRATECLDIRKGDLILASKEIKRGEKNRCRKKKIVGKGAMHETELRVTGGEAIDSANSVRTS